ncbi:hypothetical protein Tco_0399664 [Tanacetum coccineum]
MEAVSAEEQRRKYFAEERARAKRNKPMTQSQLKTYMMNYLKNQGTWKLSQLKNLSFEDVKEEFDKLVKQVESFAPINFEATKASLKRFGEELQTKTPKRLKSDEAKDDDSEDSDEVSEQDDSISDKKTSRRKTRWDCYKMLKNDGKQAGIRKYECSKIRSQGRKMRRISTWWRDPTSSIDEFLLELPTAGTFNTSNLFFRPQHPPSYSSGPSTPPN